MKYDRWPTREERQRMLDEIAAAGGVSAWIRKAGEKQPITAEQRARHAAANAVADRFGVPRPYPDLDAYPDAESGE